MRRLILPLLIALPTGWFGSLVGGETLPPPRRAPDSLTTPAHALSGSLEALGATLTRTEHAEGPLPTTHPVPLPLGRCTSVVALAATAFPIRLRAVDASGAELVRSAEGFVAGLSLCELVPSLGPVSLLVEPGEELVRREPSERDLGGSVELRWFEGGDFDAASLPLGTPSPRLHATATSTYRHHLARLGSVEDGALLPPTDVAADAGTEGAPPGAWLLPRSEATARFLQLAATLGSNEPTLRPRVHPASSPSATADDADIEPLWHGPSGYQRVLAVVDPGDLPVEGAEVPCAQLSFVALAPHTSSVARVQTLTDDASPLAGARDSFCPGDPLRLYVVPPSDRSVYRLVLHAAEGSGPRRAAPVPGDPGEHAVLRRARAECEADPAACITVARHLRFGTYGPPDPSGATAAYERACEADPSVCLETVAHLDEVDGRRALALLTSSCSPEGPPRNAAACATLGDRYRLGRGASFDLTLARAAYVRGCVAGDTRACRNRDAMDLLEL